MKRDEYVLNEMALVYRNCSRIDTLKRAPMTELAELKDKVESGFRCEEVGHTVANHYGYQPALRYNPDCESFRKSKNVCEEYWDYSYCDKCAPESTLYKIPYTRDERMELESRISKLENELSNYDNKITKIINRYLDNIEKVPIVEFKK